MFASVQVSDMLEIPPSTLRRYVKHFAERLSDEATKKRGRRFTERDVSILARARELIQQGRSPDKVASLLQVVGEEEEKPEDNTSALALVPSTFFHTTPNETGVNNGRLGYRYFYFQCCPLLSFQKETALALHGRNWCRSHHWSILGIYLSQSSFPIDLLGGG